jgi:hypothetical protein
MGRQIIFHMLPDDRTAFLRFVQQRDPVILTDFTADCDDVQPVDLGERSTKGRDWLCLWNKALLPFLKRKYVPESNRGPYYRMDSSLPILEFSLPIQTVWDERPSLNQGRLYAYAYQDHTALQAWYEALARWLRKNFTKNPVTWMSGYVGPAAYRWYQSGGLLLPFLSPPVNEEWRARIHAQHLTN